MTFIDEALRRAANNGSGHKGLDVGIFLDSYFGELSKSAEPCKPKMQEDIDKVLDSIEEELRYRMDDDAIRSVKDQIKLLRKTTVLEAHDRCPTLKYVHERGILDTVDCYGECGEVYVQLTYKLLEKK